MSKSILDVSSGIKNLKFGQDHVFEDLQDEKHWGIINWLSPLNMASKQIDTLSRRQERTGLRLQRTQPIQSLARRR